MTSKLRTTRYLESRDDEQGSKSPGVSGVSEFHGERGWSCPMFCSERACGWRSESLGVQAGNDVRLSCAGSLRSAAFRRQSKDGIKDGISASSAEPRHTYGSNENGGFDALTVHTTVWNFVFQCFWMHFGATHAPEINELQPWKYLSRERSGWGTWTWNDAKSRLHSSTAHLYRLITAWWLKSRAFPERLGSEEASGSWGVFRIVIHRLSRCRFFSMTTTPFEG